jgi:hypothetical protein
MAYQRRTRGAGADEMQWAGAPFIRAHRVRLTCCCGGDGTGRRLDAAAHGVYARSGHNEPATVWELREEHVREVLSIHRWQGVELDRGSASRCPCGATRGASTTRLPDYACARVALRKSLDGALSAVSAWPAEQATQGFIIELLARASRLALRWAVAE